MTLSYLEKIPNTKHRLAGTIFCDFCKLVKVKAIWQKIGTPYFKFNYACNKHAHLIKKPANPEHLTEADYQTWYNL